MNQTPLAGQSEKRTRAWAHARRAAGYLRDCRGIATGAFSCLVLGSGLAIAGPWAVRLLVDRGVTARNVRSVALFAGVFLISEIFRQGADYLQSVLLRKIGQRSAHALRIEIFSRLQQVSPSYVEAHPPGQVVTLLTSDVGAVSDALSTGVIGIFRDALVFAGTGAVLLFLHPKFGLLTIACALVVGFPAVLFRRRTGRAAHQAREALARMNETLEENLSGHEVIQLFGIERDRHGRFREVNQHLSKAFLVSLRTRSVFDTGATLSSALAMALVIGLGGAQMAEGSLSLGTWLAAVQYVPFLLGGVGGVADKTVTILSGLVAGERIFQVLDLPDHLPAGSAVRHSGERAGGLEVSSVRFGYHEGLEVLRGFSVNIQAGEKVALVGRSGAGKTTLARLLARFHDPWEGMVSWRGCDLRTIPLSELRRVVAFVTQEVAIFSGTILENVALGLDRMGRSEILEASRAVGLGALAERMPRGYDALLSAGGPELSAGERQLLSLARVMVRQPEILILDEPTASVDQRAECRILGALGRLSQGKTVITVAHRYSTLRDARRALVMDSGRIVEDGSPGELLGRGGYFGRMAELHRYFAGPAAAGREERR